MINTDIVRFNYELENAMCKLFDIKTTLIGNIPFKSKLSDLEITVMAFIYLYGYSKEVIAYVAKRRLQKSEQSVRNTISDLIKSGYLLRMSKNNVILQRELINFQ